MKDSTVAEMAKIIVKTYNSDKIRSEKECLEEIIEVCRYLLDKKTFPK